MAKYATLSDILDKSIQVKEEDLNQADRVIDNHLRLLGIEPKKLKLPNEFLKDIAVKYACYVASTREAMGDNTVYIEKAKQYEKQYKDLLNSLSIASFPELQTETNVSPIGTVKFYRG